MTCTHRTYFYGNKPNLEDSYFYTIHDMEIEFGLVVPIYEFIFIVQVHFYLKINYCGDTDKQKRDMCEKI